jgi:hypothetical protein
MWFMDCQMWFLAIISTEMSFVMGKNYIPGKDAEFDAFFMNLIDNVDTKTSGTPPAWPHIPGEASGALIDAYQPWHTAYVKTLGPHTKVDTEVKKEKKKAAVALIRPFVKQYLHFPPVTDADRTAMGIPNYGGGGGPVAPPTVWPELRADTGTSLHLFVHYRDPLHPRGGKPDKVTGMELRWAVLDAPPEHIDELVHSSFDTDSPLDLPFDLSDRGKKVFMAGRWEIHREGLKGPLSPIIDAIIT